MTNVHEAEEQLAKVDVATSSMLFVIGLGSGCVLDALDRRGWTGRVVAFEPEPSRVEARQWGRWSTGERLTILLGPSYDGLDRIVPSLDPERSEPVIVVNHEIAATCVEASKHAIRVAARAWFGARANQEARREHAGRYLLNTLRNVRAIATEGDAAALAGAFPRVPALVVAAGPSLDRNLGEIVEHRHHALVIAVDTALRPLLARGIEPDLVVAVDPSEANARHLTDLSSCPGTWLVAEGSLDPAALPPFEGRTFFFRVANHHPWPWLQSLGLEHGRLRAWGSVLTTAFDLTLAMGCDPIVFAGADLAFTGGQPYARGTTYEADWRREEAWGETLDGIWASRIGAWPETIEDGVDGTPVRTAPHLRSFRDWIVREAAKATDRTIVNATGGGILVGEGVRQDSIAGALAGRPRPDAVQTSLARLHAASASRASLVGPPEVAADTRRTWIDFACVSADRIATALGARTAVDPARTPPPSAVDAIHPGLSDLDAAYLADLAKTTVIRLIALTDPAQDLLSALTRELGSLQSGEAIVVVDDLGLTVGDLVRRAADALLCERPDVWLEYRRMVEFRSRLTVIRTGALQRTPPPVDADADKWSAEHEAVAARLAPLVVERLAPESVVDVGCGAGYWLKALAASGVSTLRGVTPRRDDETVIRGVMRAPIDAVPDLGRRFDICLCLEVIQRVAPDAQERVVEACARLSDVVVFSSRVPGAPGSSPHDRPLPYWAALFWRHGYVLEDSLRGLGEERWDFPSSVYDCFVIFRRQFTREQAADPSPQGRALTDLVLRSAARIHELYTHGVWWALVAVNRAAPPPRSPTSAWTIPPARFAPAVEPTRVFRFRTDTARWYFTHHAATIRVFEDGRALPDVGPIHAVARAANGGWALWRDEIAVRASDGSDPRTNGRTYTVEVPSHVAWAESRPLDECVANRF